MIWVQMVEREPPWTMPIKGRIAHKPLNQYIYFQEKIKFMGAPRNRVALQKERKTDCPHFFNYSCMPILPSSKWCRCFNFTSPHRQQWTECTTRALSGFSHCSNSCCQRLEPLINWKVSCLFGSGNCCSENEDTKQQHLYRLPPPTGAQYLSASLKNGMLSVLNKPSKVVPAN